MDAIWAFYICVEHAIHEVDRVSHGSCFGGLHRLNTLTSCRDKLVSTMVCVCVCMTVITMAPKPGLVKMTWMVARRCLRTGYNY